MTSTHPTPAPASVVAIDDNEGLLLLVRNALERTGQFQVVAQAADGEQGVAAVRTVQPDLVLLDILMPVMDGIQALPLIREACPDAIVVMLSALGDASGMPQKAMSLGAHGYLHKDGRINALPEQLRVILGSVKAERAARQAREERSPGHARRATDRAPTSPR
jgi:DNA-binding NarL/FixJ family response regulator